MNYAKPCFATLDQLRSLHALPTSYLHLLPPEIIPIISAANDAFLQSSRVRRRELQFSSHRRACVLVCCLRLGFLRLSGAIAFLPRGLVSLLAPLFPSA